MCVKSLGLIKFKKGLSLYSKGHIRKVLTRTYHQIASKRQKAQQWEVQRNEVIKLYYINLTENTARLDRKSVV